MHEKAEHRQPHNDQGKWRKTWPHDLEKSSSMCQMKETSHSSKQKQSAMRYQRLKLIVIQQPRKSMTARRKKAYLKKSYSTWIDAQRLLCVKTPTDSVVQASPCGWELDGAWERKETSEAHSNWCNRVWLPTTHCKDAKIHLAMSREEVARWDRENGWTSYS